MLKKYTDLIIDKYDDHMDALVLVGSQSRGEALPSSDFEFLVVAKPDALRKIDRNYDTYGGRLSVGFTTKRHLKKLKPYIFTLETKKFGKVLWGEKDVLDHIPDYSYEDLDRIDGFILLNNRIVEQLELLIKIEEGRVPGRHEINKGYIQLVNSFLAFNGKYKVLYPEKLSEFLKVYKEDDTDLTNKVKEAFASLLQLESLVTSKREALEKWQELKEYFREMWLYEKGILGGKDPANLVNRFKGWLKLALNGKMRLGYVKYILRTSPQFMIYGKAVKEYFGGKVDLERAKGIVKEWKEIVK